MVSGVILMLVMLTPTNITVVEFKGTAHALMNSYFEGIDGPSIHFSLFRDHNCECLMPFSIEFIISFSENGNACISFSPPV